MSVNTNINIDTKTLSNSLDVKKRVLFVTNHFQYSDGVASVLRSLLLNLPEDKFDVSLLVIYKFDSKFAEPIKDKVTIIKGFNTYFRGFDKIINLLSPSFIYHHFIKDSYDLEIAFQIGIPTKCIAVSNNPNRICWMHTYDSKMKFKKYYKRFPFMVTVAKAGYDKLILEGFNPRNCDYCYNIIDESDLLGKANDDFSYHKQKEFAVITVARLAPDKGFLRYLRCIKEIRKHVDNVEFWIVGGGPDDQKMREYIEENGLDDIVIMFGQQTNPYKFLANADLYFCCSFREGFSTSCQEAALLGIPVVSVEVDGAEELVNLSESGKVISNTDESIVQNLSSILSDRNLISEWKRKAYKNRNKLYKQERLNKIISIMNNIVNRDL